jgi:hypothetical protein
MESPTLAAQSVCAEMSEFCRAELEAFVATNRSQRPASWARVEKLRMVCRRESPATLARLSILIRLLAEHATA